VSVRASPPSAEEQLTFLTKLQRLFTEGDFTATYKFALLISFADLAVESGRDDGDALSLHLRQIAERFVGLYWRHVTPYGGGSSDSQTLVLSQNAGAQAAVLTAIANFRAQSKATSLLQARREPGYGALLTQVASVVSAQPLNYLQNFGGVTDRFLYERTGPGRITLKPGVAYCLRRFYPLVQQLSRSHWVGHVKSNHRNHVVLGDGADLEEFLFSTSRQSLALIGAELRKLDGAHCFYCGHGLEHADVDHFVPFSLYPRDLIGNFVLAHAGCNRSKSDTLAAKPHLERWMERLMKKDGQLQEIGLSAGVQTDSTTLRKVAMWGYSSACQSNSRAWLSPANYLPVDSSYAQILESTAADFDEV
jgi:5-methylcytosine-specific restriction endonuclease McrA